MYIRSVRLTDLARHRRLSQHLLRLNLPESAVTGLSPFDVALVSWLPVRSGLRTFVFGDDRPRAFIQVAARDSGYIWDVTAIGSEVDALDSASLDDPGHPWVLLLNSASVLATRRRVTRLLARVPEDAREMACFRQAGYHPYGRKRIYRRILEASDRVIDTAGEPRTQRVGDAWAIHRLYFQSVPRPVQEAEAHTSNRWELRKARPGGPRETGWLLEDEAETIAYIRTVSRRRVHMVDCLFQAERRDVLARVVRQTLGRLPATPGDQVFWRLPDYQADAEEALLEAGFSLVGTQCQLVKYLAVKVAARERSFVPAARSKVRRASSVQSYLRRAGER